MNAKGLCVHNPPDESRCRGRGRVTASDMFLSERQDKVEVQEHISAGSGPGAGSDSERLMSTMAGVYGEQSS